MNGEWIYVQIASLLSMLILAYIGYRLGIRRQKIQALREYITEIVKDVYPILFNEIRRNSGLLDNYLENPFVNFNFPKLEEIWHKGFPNFMKEHHRDLFLLVASYRNNIRPKFRALQNLQVESRKKISVAWLKHLKKSLFAEVASESVGITEYLLNVINPHYTFSDILNQREDQVRPKIEACFWEKTAHIHSERRAYLIRRESEKIDFDELSQSLIEIAKPETTNFLERYKELKKQNDKEVKGKLLLLLQKYISNPVS